MSYIQHWSFPLKFIESRYGPWLLWSNFAFLAQISASLGWAGGAGHAQAQPSEGSGDLPAALPCIPLPHWCSWLCMFVTWWGINVFELPSPAKLARAQKQAQKPSGRAGMDTHRAHSSYCWRNKAKDEAASSCDCAPALLTVSSLPC